MPKLRAENIPPTTGAYARPVRDPGPGEVLVECPLELCSWSTIRNAGRHAWSAAEAHRIHHQRGML